MNLFQLKMKSAGLVVLSLMLLAFPISGGGASPGYGTVNLAQGIAVTALTGTVQGSTYDVTDGTIDKAWYSFDWYGGFYNNAFTIDLGAVYSIGMINAYTMQTTAFRISSSTDGVNWTVQHSYDWMASSKISTPNLYAPVTLSPNGSYSARYLKYEGWAWWDQFVGIEEFQVYEWLAAAPPLPSLDGLTNLALGMPAANGPGYTSVAGHDPVFLTDGNIGTYWLGTNNPTIYYGSYDTFGYAYVDLGALQAIQAIRLTFPSGAEGCQSYILWMTDTFSGTMKWYAFGGDPAMVASNPPVTSSETRTFFLPAPVTARYVWMYMENWATPEVLPPGLAEVEVFGELPSVVTYTITASAGANGSISPLGSVPVHSGASQTFDITPNAGYHVADVLVDGASVVAVASYTFTGVSADHTISATFAISCPSLKELRDHVVAYGVSDIKNNGLMNSLLAKLDAAQASLDKENANAFRGQLSAFIKEVEAQSGKGINAKAAETLIAEAEALLRGCTP